MTPPRNRPARTHRSALIAGSLLLVLAGIGTAAPAAAAPGRTAAAPMPRSAPLAAAALPTAALPATTCTPTTTGTTTTRLCDLWAKSGTVSLPGTPGYAALPVWGFTDTAGGVAGLSGPPLIVSVNDVVTITVHNTLTAAVSLDIPNLEGLSPVSDAAGAQPAATKDYTFTAQHPGTYLYEAGPTPGQKQQLAMGLIGALIVRPAVPTQAYDADSAFTDEAVLVLSDVDPKLNNAANPGAFDMRSFNPTYRLINGKSFPTTDPFTAAAGGHLLLRMVNAGSQDHALALFGPHQRVISDDSSPLPLAQRYSVAAETVGAGQSLDTIVDIPATAPTGLKYVLADSGGELFNPQGATAGASVAFGGMLTTIAVIGGGAPPACTPSIATATSSPATIGQTESTTLSATIIPCAGVSLIRAEYSDGPAGPWTAMPLTGTTASIPVSGLTNGQHTLYVRAVDSGGTGAPGTAAVYVDGTGPTTTGVSVLPDPHRSAQGPVTVRATGDDRATGGAAVTAAEAFDGGVVTGTPVLPATIPATTALTLTSGGGTPVGGFTGTLTIASGSGKHAVWVRATDSRGNAGPWVAVQMTEDNVAPVAAAGFTPVITPNPTNGKVGVNVQTAAIRALVRFTDTQTVITGMVGWIDTVTTQPGAAFLAADGVWNTLAETGQLDIPLTTVRALPDGPHKLLVRATDAAGNVSATVSVPFTVDKSAPVITGLTWTSTGTPPARTITVTGRDNVAVTGAEYYTTNADPGAGKGTQVTISPAAATGSWTFPVPAAATYRVRLRDAAGNWSAVTTRVVP